MKIQRKNLLNNSRLGDLDYNEAQTRSIFDRFIGSLPTFNSVSIAFWQTSLWVSIKRYIAIAVVAVVQVYIALCFLHFLYCLLSLTISLVLSRKRLTKPLDHSNMAYLCRSRNKRWDNGPTTYHHLVSLPWLARMCPFTDRATLCP